MLSDFTGTAAAVDGGRRVRFRARHLRVRRLRGPVVEPFLPEGRVRDDHLRQYGLSLLAGPDALAAAVAVAVKRRDAIVRRLLLLVRLRRFDRRWWSRRRRRRRRRVLARKVASRRGRRVVIERRRRRCRRCFSLLSGFAPPRPSPPLPHPAKDVVLRPDERDARRQEEPPPRKDGVQQRQRDAPREEPKGSVRIPPSEQVEDGPVREESYPQYLHGAVRVLLLDGQYRVALNADAQRPFQGDDVRVKVVLLLLGAVHFLLVEHPDHVPLGIRGAAHVEAESALVRVELVRARTPAGGGAYLARVAVRQGRAVQPPGLRDAVLDQVKRVLLRLLPELVQVLQDRLLLHEHVHVLIGSDVLDRRSGGRHCPFIEAFGGGHAALPPRRNAQRLRKVVVDAERLQASRLGNCTGRSTMTTVLDGFLRQILIRICRERLLQRQLRMPVAVRERKLQVIGPAHVFERADVVVVVPHAQKRQNAHGRL
mmetsp:Transcript_6240/g.10733  ORF Transcript_6240/g.10733 Transcript_6240/m.10733 type:complete len:482 (+) Transcript_6240:389-1834(+)